MRSVYIHAFLVLVMTSVHHAVAQVPTDSPTPTPAPPTPVPIRAAASDDAPLSNSAIIGIAVAITIAVFIGVFVFSKWYIGRYEDRVTLGGQRNAALGQANAADSDDGSDGNQVRGGAGQFDGLFVGQSAPQDEERLPGTAGSPIMPRRGSQAAGRSTAVATTMPRDATRGALDAMDHAAASEFFSPREADAGAALPHQDLKRPKLTSATRARMMKPNEVAVGAQSSTARDVAVRSALDTEQSAVPAGAAEPRKTSAVSAAAPLQGGGSDSTAVVRPSSQASSPGIASSSPATAAATPPATCEAIADIAIDGDTLEADAPHPEAHSDTNVDPTTEHYDFAAP